jgi:hypothetical protein
MSDGYILAIDPGNEESAWVLLGEDLSPIKFAKESNKKAMESIAGIYLENVSDFTVYDPLTVVVEMIASYGMAVGKEVFETCVWIGRFMEQAETYGYKAEKVYRKDAKLNLCGTSKAKDSNIRQALIDRFGPVGTKKNPGWFYGVSKDVWAAVAVGVTYADNLKLR